MELEQSFDYKGKDTETKLMDGSTHITTLIVECKCGCTYTVIKGGYSYCPNCVDTPTKYRLTFKL